MTHLAQIELLRISTNHHPGLHVHDRAALENALSAGYSLPSEAFRTSLVHSRPALSRRQSYTQRRFLAALKTVEEIRALTRPKRIAMEI